MHERRACVFNHSVHSNEEHIQFLIFKNMSCLWPLFLYPSKCWCACGTESQTRTEGICNKVRVSLQGGKQRERAAQNSPVAFKQVLGKIIRLKITGSQDASSAHGHSDSLAGGEVTEWCFRNLCHQPSGSSLGSAHFWIAFSHPPPLGGGDLVFTEQLIDMHQIALYIPSGGTRSLVTLLFSSLR